MLPARASNVCNMNSETQSTRGQLQKVACDEQQSSGAAEQEGQEQGGVCGMGKHPGFSVVSGSEGSGASVRGSNRSERA